jgi:hypothetical protein
MTSDLSLGGGVWELAVERLSHGQSPLRMQQPPCPIHTPNTTSRRPGHPISCILQHPRRETTRRVHRPHASSTPTAHHHHRWQLLPFPHSTIALAADPPGSTEPACVPRVCRRVTYAPAPSYVCRRTSSLQGVCAERDGGVREQQRVVGRHAQRGHRHTARSQGSVRAPPAPHRAFSLAHVAARAYPVLMLLFVRLDTLHE